MEILIISGLSGGGKSRTASFLEDMGFYIVDNMPAGMILKFAEFCSAGSGRYNRVALVYDVRTADTFDEFLEVLSTLRQREYNCTLLFLEANVDTIIKRYKETRRMHPLQDQCGSLEAAVHREITLMDPVRAQADGVVDSSRYSTTRLRGELLRLFGGSRRPAPQDRLGPGGAGLCIFLPGDGAVSGEAPGASGLRPAVVPGGREDGAGDRHRLYRRPSPLRSGHPRTGRVHPKPGLSGNRKPPGHDEDIAAKDKREG